MKITYVILVVLHGLIHLLGFVKGFGISQVKELSLPISKPMGVLWLVATLLFVLYIALYLSEHQYAWLVAFLAVLVSQVLIFSFWKDAKIGTLPNILILVIAIVSFAYYNFEQGVERETALLLSRNAIVDQKIVVESDLDRLPQPVKKWVMHSGQVGQPYIHVAKVSQSAQMQMKPDQDNWLQATAQQYSTMDTPAFIWTTEATMNPLLYFQGRDKFENGKGEMVIKLNSLLKIVDEQGPKMDEGSLQRYLGEMVWFPSLALSPYISWEAIDSSTAKATLSYQGTDGSGTFYFSSAGDFVKFSALRFKGNEAEAERYEWVLLVDEYRTFEGIRIPAKMTATWKLEDSDWTWMQLEILDVKYNENVRE